MNLAITNATTQATIRAKIKQGTFRYYASAAERSKLKLRGAMGSYIEFEYYTDNGFTADYGDKLNVAEFVYVDKSFNDIYPTSRDIYMFPQFYVKETKINKDAIYVLAYDCISLLDVDYSQRLSSIKNDFPMTIGALFDDVMQFSGIATRMSNVVFNWPAGQSIAASTINYFYYNKITARSIVDSISEILGIGLCAFGASSLIKVNYSSTGNITAWLDVKEYVICPGDGTYYQADGVTPAVNVWYKENGLVINDIVSAYDGVEIIKSDGKIVGYYYSSTPATNVYKIYGNLIAENINTYDEYILNADKIAKEIYLSLGHAFPYISAQATIFPFRNPYQIGTTARVIAPNGNYYNLPIMSLTITENGVIVESFSNSDGYSSDDAVGDAIDVQAALAKINQINNNLGYATLLNGVAVNAGTVTTYLSRDISYYKWLIALWKVSNNVRATAFFRFDDFFVANYVSLFYVDSSNTQRWCELAYDTDTSISVSASANASGDVFLFGMRLMEVSDAPSIVVRNLVDHSGNQLVDHSGNALISTVQ